MAAAALHAVCMTWTLERVLKKNCKQVQLFWQNAVVGRAGSRCSTAGEMSSVELNRELVSFYAPQATTLLSLYGDFMPPEFRVDPAKYLVRGGAALQQWPYYITLRGYCLSHFCPAVDRCAGCLSAAFSLAVPFPARVRLRYLLLYFASESCVTPFLPATIVVCCACCSLVLAVDAAGLVSPASASYHRT